MLCECMYNIDSSTIFCVDRITNPYVACKFYVKSKAYNIYSQPANKPHSTLIEDQWFNIRMYMHSYRDACFRIGHPSVEKVFR